MGFVKAWHDASVGARPWWIYISHIRGAKIVADRGASANITCPLGGGGQIVNGHIHIQLKQLIGAIQCRR